ncbi:MAG: tryptophan--tRNA ligase, partial [Candidatus Dormibacteraeota bacterium]|nr:tryptophan--tRNA ligase [Candidatus Dormibacteraeota bacterium]
LEREVARAPGSFRILTGDRPTGPLHVGHYFGTLQNRVRLQQLGVELLVLIADYQVVTDRDAPADLAGRVEEQVADYLAAGVDPGRATIFAHSQVEALNQLLLPFLSLVSVAELNRNPTVKEEIAVSGARATSALMLTYPVHQAADILFCRANLVPVGKDQLPHVELTRLIARRFNERYCPGQALFPEPEALLTSAPLLLGLDGRKMGKSLGNAIELGSSEDETARLIRGARTDAERLITYEPGRRPEVSNLLLLTALCQARAPQEVAAEIGDGGASALKQLATEAVNERLRTLRARRTQLLRDRGYLRQVLRSGNEQARTIAAGTLERVRRVMHMTY